MNVEKFYQPSNPIRGSSPDAFIALVQSYGNAVMNATKLEGINKVANKKEVAAMRRLLAAVGIKMSVKEMDELIVG